MSHYCDIIQEIMVFGKSTMICVSSNTVYLLTYIGVTSLPTACQVTVVPCSSVLHASFAIVKLGWSKSRSSQAFQSFAVYTPRGPSLSLNSGRPTIQFANLGSLQQVSCVSCVPATRRSFCRSLLSAGSTVSRLIADEVNDDELQAMLNGCHELQRLELGSCVSAVSARGLASLTVCV